MLSWQAKLLEAWVPGGVLRAQLHVCESLAGGGMQLAVSCSAVLASSVKVMTLSFNDCNEFEPLSCIDAVMILNLPNRHETSNGNAK